MKTLSKIILIGTTILFFSCSNNKEKSNWLNTNIEWNFSPEKPSVKDDFYQSVNYERIKNEIITNSNITAGLQNDVNLLIEKQISLLNDVNFTASDYETDLFIELYNMCLDWKSRNQEGVKPIIPIIEKIQSIQNLKDFEILLQDDTFRLFFPIAINLKCNNGYFYTPMLNINYLFGKTPEQFKNFYKAMFIKIGYEAELAEKLINTAFEFEKLYNFNYINNISSNNNSNFPIHFNSIKTEFNNFPIDFYLESYGVQNLSYIFSYFEAFKNLDKNYTEENLETIKTLCICKVLLSCTQFLDRESFELYVKFLDEKIYEKSLSFTNEKIAFRILNNYTPDFLGKIWYENFCSTDLIKDVETFSKEILEEYKQQISTWDWLCSGSKYNLIELLNKTKVIVGHSMLYDYSKLKLSKNLCETILEIIKYEKNVQCKKCFNEVDKYEWEHPLQECNAFYNQTNNSVNINAGYIYACDFNKILTLEEQLSQLGFVLAHEISHLIYNQKFLTGNDYNSLETKLAEIIKNFSNKEILKSVYCNGDFCKDEICADYFAMNFLLELTKKYSDFDYKKFFENYARANFIKYPEAVQKLYVTSDSHPPYYLRVNCILQFFDEFYKSYGIHKKDGMYLEKKYRVKF